jgi:hypothetical protein
LYVSYLFDKKRTEAIQLVANEMGLAFEPKGDNTLLAGLSGFELFKHGHSKRLKNLIRGATRQTEIALFDYRYTTGGGRHQQIWRQTVVLFRLNQASLPTFTLRPESVWDKLGAVLGFKDINFETHPDFSKRYVLKGQDEAAIRRVFNVRVLAFYEAEPNICTEGAGDQLLVYRRAKQIKPEEWRAFLDEAFKVLTVFNSSSTGW